MNVVGRGECLEYTVKWLSTMISAEEINKKWLVGSQNSIALHSYQPMIGWFQNFVSKLRARESAVRTMTRIPLPFEDDSRLNTTY